MKILLLIILFVFLLGCGESALRNYVVTQQDGEKMEIKCSDCYLNVIKNKGEFIYRVNCWNGWELVFAKIYKNPITIKQKGRAK